MIQLETGSAPASGAVRRALAAHREAENNTTVSGLLTPRMFGARRAERQPRRLPSPDGRSYRLSEWAKILHHFFL